MSHIPISYLRTARIALVAGLLGSSALVGLAAAAPSAPPQNAGLAVRAVLPDFSDLVAKVKPAVVSITIPIFVLVMVFQRYLVSGLTAGAVKG